MEQVGKGGFGMVFRALNRDVNRVVAIKIPRLQILASPDLESRFIREAKAAGTLSHPNIATVFEAGRDEEVFYIASQFVDGISLAEWLSMSGALPNSNQVAKLISVLAGALQHAHDRGVLHRDLKPANILLKNNRETNIDDSDGHEIENPMITDFGMAKLDAESSEITV